MKFKIKETGFGIDGLIKILLKNRGIKTNKEIEEFLNPKLETVTVKKIEIDSKNLKKALDRITLAIKDKEQIVIFGDYDVDGICGTAILWETLNSLGARVTPYIPHRIDEGYGLSIAGINNVILNSFQDLKKNKKKMLKLIRQPQSLSDNRRQVQHDNKRGLIITVDNGIVANKAVEFAKENGIDVIITDHHVCSNKPPKAFAIVHTTKLCGTGVAYLLSQEIKNLDPSAAPQDDIEKDNHLELVALATVADLVPLKGANRTLLKFGLEALRKTKRIGLLELFKEAGLEKKSIGVYEIGHIIAPRLNAMGRLEYAMDSLRLICTTNPKRAENLARLLGDTNRQRQDLTLQTVLHAKEQVEAQGSPLRPDQRDFKGQVKLKNLLFISHESYEQGVIGLVAGKLADQYYRPSIVVSIGKKFSKGSARSVSGFNIIEFIRKYSSFLTDAGGHPMAAGFTIETTKLLTFQKALEDKAELVVNKDLLTRTLKIDCEIPLSLVDINLYESLQQLSPYGMGNPQPTFKSKKVTVDDMRLVGAEKKHIKFRFKIYDLGFIIDGIGFGMGEKYSQLNIGDLVDIVYTIDKNEWLARRSLGEGGNGSKSLQLKIKDIRRLST